jgi:glycosyltransferase involved in cell wall biosynthesis
MRAKQRNVAFRRNLKDKELWVIEKPKLLIIGPTPPPYHGVAVAIQALLRSPLSENFDVSHLELGDRRGIQHVNKPDLHDVLLFINQWCRLLGLLIRHRPCMVYLVISQTTIGFLRDSFLLWPAYFLGSRVIIHLHGGNLREWFLGRNWFLQAYVRCLLCRVHRVIVLGVSLQELFQGLVEKSKISVVSNGIEWRTAKSKSEPNSIPRYRILHLSTLSHLKGALVLLSAVPLVIRHRQDVEFIFAGPWSHFEDQQEAEAFIARENLSKYVTFTGQVEGETKYALLESADVFAFPGVQQEGQPLVVLEAMAAGLPVIFTNRGCLQDTVIDGETGLEVPIKDPRRLADRILWLLDHPENMQTMGTRARLRYEACYTKTRHVTNMIEVFNLVLQR